MKKDEKTYIEGLPEAYKPLTAWKYFGLTILYSIPVLGFIMIIVHSLSDKNINRRSFARSFFCGFLLVAIALVVAIVFMGGFGAITSAIESGDIAGIFQNINVPGLT